MAFIPSEEIPKWIVKVWWVKCTGSGTAVGKIMSQAGGGGGGGALTQNFGRYVRGKVKNGGLRSELERKSGGLRNWL